MPRHSHHLIQLPTRFPRLLSHGESPRILRTPGESQCLSSFLFNLLSTLIPMPHISNPPCLSLLSLPPIPYLLLPLLLLNPLPHSLPTPPSPLPSPLPVSVAPLVLPALQLPQPLPPLPPLLKLANELLPSSLGLPVPHTPLADALLSPTWLCSSLSTFGRYASYSLRIVFSRLNFSAARLECQSL